MDMMLDEVKRALSISKSNKIFDDTLNDLINGAYDDLLQSGVSKNLSISLYRRSVVIYCIDNWNINPSEIKPSLSYFQNIVKLRDNIEGSA